MPRQADPTLGAGDLDKRVTLLKPIYNEPIEDEIIGYDPVTDVWAAVDPAFAQEINEGGRTVATKIVAVVIRYRTDIDERWQIQDHGHTYQIRGIADIARRRIQLELTCEEVI
jgi:SPP1 family predicted phage head-tail adaptor